MIDYKYWAGISAAAVFTLAAGSASYAADPPDQSNAALQAAKPVEKLADDDGHMMMDHSPADTKSMSRMKDRKIPIHHAGDPVPKADVADKPVDHMMMNHSPADTKSMSKMKDKKIPIHHAGDPVPKSDGGDKPVDHMMMDHSPADTKSMSKMKEKKIPIHHSGSEEAKDDGGLPKN